MLQNSKFVLQLMKYCVYVFRLETKQDIQKYRDVICDFSYFKTSDVFESNIETNVVSNFILKPTLAYAGDIFISSCPLNFTGATRS